MSGRRDAGGDDRPGGGRRHDQPHGDDRAEGHGGHFTTSADINGTSIRVLVDTGATAVALSYEDARSVGLRPGSLDYTVPVSTANGVTQAARVRLKKVVIDGVSVDDVDGLVLPEGALEGTLLGMSFLGRLSSFRVEDGVLYLKD